MFKSLKKIFVSEGKLRKETGIKEHCSEYKALQDIFGIGLGSFSFFFDTSSLWKSRHYVKYRSMTPIHFSNYFKIPEEHMEQAIKLCEENGVRFDISQKNFLLTMCLIRDGGSGLEPFFSYNGTGEGNYRFVQDGTIESNFYKKLYEREVTSDKN